MSRSEYSRGGRVADTQPLARPRRFGPRCRRLGQARRAASTRGRRAGPGPYVSPMGRSAPADGPPSHGPGSAPSPRFWAALAFPSLRTRGRANAVLPLKSPGKSSRAKGCPGRLALAQTTLIEGSIALYRDAALGVGSPRVLLPAGSTGSPRPGRDSRLRRAAGHGARRCARCRRHRRQIDSGLPTAAVSGSTVSGGETRHPLLNPRVHEERHHLALDGRCPAELRGSKPNAPTRLRGGGRSTRGPACQHAGTHYPTSEIASSKVATRATPLSSSRCSTTSWTSRRSGWRRSSTAIDIPRRATSLRIPGITGRAKSTSTRESGSQSADRVVLEPHAGRLSPS